MGVMGELEVGLTRPQAQFMQLPNKFRAFVGGFGSGKTYVGSVALCAHSWEWPGVNLGYFAPTYAMIRDIFYPTIDEVVYTMGLSCEIKESAKEVHLYSGSTYRCTIICRSMDNPDSIIGFKIGQALIDEFDTLPTDKALKVWRKVIARMRYKQDGLKNGIDVATTPEGFKATHKLFVEHVAAEPALAANYGLVRASTYDNEKHLPGDYIASLYEAYPAELVDAYIDGRFVNMTAGTVYRYYNRERNRSAEVIRPKENLRIGMDFNVTKMAASIYVDRPNGWHLVNELKDVYDTPDMIKLVKERWKDQGHRIIVYPDATGGARKSVDASRSDIALLREAGFTIEADLVNPPVKDRVIATNKRFEIGKLWINDRTAPRAAQCFEGQVYDDNGEPDKKGGFDHQNDASTYPIVREFPILHNRLQRVTIAGI